jgi:hypothetical protein
MHPEPAAQPASNTPAPDTTNRRAETARINGAKSRGPVTLAGKLNSRRNALKHGLYATVLNPDEPAFATREGFIQILLGLVNDLMPQTCVERHLFMDMAMAKWRLGMVCGQETQILDNCADAIGRLYPGASPETKSAEGFVQFADESRALAAFDRRENRFTRIYHRSLLTLHQLRRARSAEIKDDKTNQPTQRKQTAEEITNRIATEFFGHLQYFAAALPSAENEPAPEPAQLHAA